MEIIKADARKHRLFFTLGTDKYQVLYPNYRGKKIKPQCYIAIKYREKYSDNRCIGAIPIVPLPVNYSIVTGKTSVSLVFFYLPAGSLSYQSY